MINLSLPVHKKLSSSRYGHSSTMQNSTPSSVPDSVGLTVNNFLANPSVETRFVPQVSQKKPKKQTRLAGLTGISFTPESPKDDWSCFDPVGPGGFGGWIEGKVGCESRAPTPFPPQDDDSDQEIERCTSPCKSKFGFRYNFPEKINERNK